MSRFATDLLRVLAACYIVFNHVSWPVFMGLGTPHEYWLSRVVAFGNQFGKPSVLFFIFLSGFAFSGLAGERRLSTGRFYLNRVARILPPFLVATLLAFAIKGVFDPLRILASLPFGTAMFHLYFVPLISYLYLLFPLLRKIRPSLWSAGLYFGAAIVLYATMRLVSVDKPDDVLLTLCGGPDSPLCRFLKIESAETRDQVFIWIRYFVFSLPFFQAGIWLGSQESRAILERWRERRPWAGWAMLPLTALSYVLVCLDFFQSVEEGLDPDSAGIIWRLSVSLYAFACIFAVSLLLRRGYDARLSWLARCSFLVYLVHPFFIPYFRDWNPVHAVAPILLLSWGLAAFLQWLALKYDLAGFFLGEGDRLFAPLAGSPRTQSPPSNTP